MIMGPLHEGKLKVAPAFYRTQVDLFGPFDAFDLTNKRKTVKIWFVVFCCITTSAVDIRVVEDYSTEAFLMAPVLGYHTEWDFPNCCYRTRAASWLRDVSR